MTDRDPRIAVSEPEVVETVEPEVQTVKLFDPRFEQYSYGPYERDGAINFGARGGHPPHTWEGPRDHPLLERMLMDRPEIMDVTNGDPKAAREVYVCYTCLGKFPTFAGLKGHMLSAHKVRVVAGTPTATV